MFDMRWIVATATQPWPGAAFVAHWGRAEPWRALPRWLRHRLLCLAASSHHPPSLDAALAHCGTVLQADAVASAVIAGDLDTCRRLYEAEGCDWDASLVGTAAGLSGSLPVCEWLVEAIPNRGVWRQHYLLPAAILAGHERVVDWALERLGNDRDWSGAWVGAAAKAGRLELLQRLAVRDPWPQPAGAAAAAGGAAVGAAGGGGPAAAAAGGPLPAADPGAQQQVNGFMELIALAAAEQGHVAVLRLLRGRGFVFRARQLRAVLGESVQGGLASLRYLLLEGPVDMAQGGGAAAADWSCLFRDAAVKGADLWLLRHLHEQLGAAIDLVAVGCGGSEEALSWAVAALEAAGQAPEPLSCRAFQQVLSSGNWAAANFLLRHGLAPPKQELLRHMLLEDAHKTRIADLQGVVGMGGRQDRLQAAAQVQWTAELHAALAFWPSHGSTYETPCREEWLMRLVRAVGAELAATARGHQGRGTR
ncbi:hypothetical protein HXX76_014584 [Chlamydomonas incerta]|uniref:Uncharacterized protein n=1 Tax=Chlamydomonas incerta TaxID=51695 RepID=A0A835VQU4_CHLIN|nr:hypothetical protein HXX76_014584 [Chlamydomonas incerta]|eukprot:KAG2424375.1 hypothetical protein HXX76_014584 [Chlamydomonas incerta]